jgi:hypothetical protein
VGGGLRVFKTKDFVRFARKEKIDDAALCGAVARAERGIVDADLTGGLIKQRVPRKGQGRSGGFRTIIAYRRGDRAFFVYGFAKNERENITDDELAAIKITARLLMSLQSDKMEEALKARKIDEVMCDGDKVQE